MLRKWGEASTGALFSARSCCSAHLGNTAKPAEKGGSTPGLPRGPCPWEEGSGASDQDVSHQLCPGPLSGTGRPHTAGWGQRHWDSSPPQPRAASPPRPGTDRRLSNPAHVIGASHEAWVWWNSQNANTVTQSASKHLGFGNSQWLYPVAEVWNKLFPSVIWVTEKAARNWIYLLISHSETPPSLCETKPGNI